MNFWSRERLPFLPVATSLPFQPHFNNPAWDIPQQVVASPFFIPGVALNPWATALPAQSLPVEDTQDPEKPSPWLTQREEAEMKEGRRNSRREERINKSRERERSRDRDRSRDRERRRKSRSRSRSRDARRSDSPRERRGRDRSRDGRESRRSDDRRRDRSPERRQDADRRRLREDDESACKRLRHSDDKYSLESANYKMQTPNETIMIRGLAQHISENDIRQDIVQCGLRPKDIRLIRKKETGVSRGFAFVEFNNTEEALCWMEQKQGVLMLQDMYRAVMQFSIVAGDASANSAPFPPADWDCPKCYAHNFKKRVTCYKCLAARPDSDPKHPGSEISPHPTTKIMIRNLDPLTTEEDLLKEVSTVSDIPIQSCQISRDSIANLSRGVCYLEMKNVLEAIKLYNKLTADSLTIQGRKVSLSYCKLQTDPPSTSEWIAGADHQQQQSYSLADVPKLAEYSARLYATHPTQKATLIQYYTQYYTNQIKQLSQNDGAQKDANSAAAVALSAMQMAQTKKAVLAGAAASALSAAAAMNAPQPQPSATAGTAAQPQAYGYMSSQQLIGNTSVGAPDMSTFVYEESSGYYFDQRTGLYYDSNTQYYYHGQDQVYLYWDNDKKVYMPASATQQKKNQDDNEKKNKKEEKDSKQQEKVKVAKRIAKDMERWAKTLNQKKDVARQTQVAVQQSHLVARTAATADIAFDVLERQEAGSLEMPRLSAQDQGALVASYGGGSESDGDEGPEEVNVHEQHHTDWVKMACLLCKRQFPSKEGLERHNQLSDLHKQNLQMWYTSRGIDQPADRSSDASAAAYRDRARERRQKFGMPDAPKTNKIKEKLMKAQQEQPIYDEPTRAGIPCGNLGSKMLQKMGWSEGMGLGKSNQGRTDIVHAVQRVATAGLGVAGSSLGSAPPGATYKDNVKRAAMARFSEMQEKEQS